MPTIVRSKSIGSGVKSTPDRVDIFKWNKVMVTTSGKSCSHRPITSLLLLILNVDGTFIALHLAIGLGGAAGVVAPVWCRWFLAATLERVAPITSRFIGSVHGVLKRQL